MKTIIKPTIDLTFICAFLIPMLVACGGGGGGSSVGSSTSGGSLSSGVPSLSDIDWPVSPTGARQAVVGSAAPSQTSAQGTEELNAISRSSNTVVASDIFGFIDTGSPIRIPLSCSGLSCSASYLGETYIFSLSHSPDFGYDTAELQPVMTHNGVSIGQIRGTSNRGTEDQEEGLEYGGWMEYSAFAVQVVYYPSIANPEVVIGAPYAFGNSTGTNPSDVSGRTGTWTGVVVGADYSVGSNRGNVIHGTATVDVDFINTDVDASFSNLVDLDNPNRSIANMDWSNIPLSNGTFSDESGSNQIRGRFYGPNHEEVSGVFDRNQISGAFGAIRGTTQ